MQLSLITTGLRKPRQSNATRSTRQRRVESQGEHPVAITSSPACGRSYRHAETPPAEPTLVRPAGWRAVPVRRHFSLLASPPTSRAAGDAISHPAKLTEVLLGADAPSSTQHVTDMRGTPTLQNTPPRDRDCRGKSAPKGN